MGNAIIRISHNIYSVNHYYGYTYKRTTYNNTFAQTIVHYASQNLDSNYIRRTRPETFLKKMHIEN